MKIELHMIQNFAPSCLNRDDTNSPKDCDFGGFRRARISSQCMKRAIRWEAGFKEELKGHLGTRSLRFPNDVKDALIKLGVAESVALECGQALQSIAKKESAKAEAEDGDDANGKKAGKNAKGNGEPSIFKTPQIAFYTAEEVQDCAKRVKSLLDKGTKPKDLIKALVDKKSPLPQPRTADIALFGRMITSDAFINMDAACQVAHAISTNRVSMDVDFFTAVDDLQSKDEAGAGMMGLTGFNSACFYRYAVLDWKQLVKNMGGDADLAGKTIAAFLNAAIRAVPSGKQNTFAAFNPPALILAVVRENGFPVNLANAFLKPVRTERADLSEESVDAMAKHWKKVHEVYGADGIRMAGFCGTVQPPAEVTDSRKAGTAAWANCESVAKLVDAVKAAINKEAR